MIASRLIAGAAALALMTGTAAANGSSRWTGFYVGGHAGYAFSGDAIYTYTVAGNFEPAGRPRPTELEGFIGGAQLGFNYQLGGLVLGLEGTYTAGDLSDTLLENPLPAGNDYRTNTSLSYLATVSGRVGLAFDHTLLYAKGGVAFTTVEFDASFLNGVAPGQRTGISNDFDRTGWVAGVGLEFAVSRNWTIGVEYAHLDFGTENVTLPVTNSGITRERLDLDFAIDTVTARISYKFD
jgi:outer membrane immunogenic protein